MVTLSAFSLLSAPVDPAAKPSGSSRPQTILVVDDEPDLRQAFKQLLEDTLTDIRVITASSGPAGLSILETERVDVIVTDYKMPDMDGLEFLTKARRQTPQAARILVTAFPDMQLAINATNDAGIESFFTKPFVPGKIVGTMRQLLADRRAEEQRSLEFARSFAALRKQVNDSRKKE